MAKSFALIGLSVLSVMSAVAQNRSLNGQVNTITTAVPFLRISPDARAGAMGDVGIATSADPNAQHWNVAKIPFAEKRLGISVTYTPWLRDLVPDIYLAYLSGYYKFGGLEGQREDNQAISFSLRYFNLGDINFTDFNAQPLGTGRPREFAFDIGYSRKLSEFLSTGVNLRYVNSNLLVGFSQPGVDAKAGKAFAADLGFFYTKSKDIDEYRKNTFNAGAVISNAGSKISYSNTRRDFIPINLGLGTAYTYGVDQYNKITIALDVNKLLVPTPLELKDSAGTPTGGYYIPEKSVVSGMLGSFNDAPGGFSEELREFQVSIGAEYWYQNQFAVRAGYFYEDKTKGDRKYFTAGVGVRYNIFELNASYLVPSGSGINRNPLANTLRFSLVFGFDKLEVAKNNDSAEE